MGVNDGALVGMQVGRTDGARVGLDDGALVGIQVGRTDGARVGVDEVGATVGI